MIEICKVIALHFKNIDIGMQYIPICTIHALNNFVFMIK